MSIPSNKLTWSQWYHKSHQLHLFARTNIGKSHRWKQSCNIKKFIRCFHESQIPNLRKFLTNICYDFQLANWDKKILFWTNKKFVFFFNCSNWEKFVEKIGETNWWTYLMNSLIDLWRNLEGGKKLRKSHHLEDVLAIPVTAEKITNLGKGLVLYYVKGVLGLFLEPPILSK